MKFQVCHLWRLSPLSNNEVCRLMMFVGYDVCCLIVFVPLDVCRIVTFVVNYDICLLKGLSQCHIYYTDITWSSSSMK